MKELKNEGMKGDIKISKSERFNSCQAEPVEALKKNFPVIP